MTSLQSDKVVRITMENGMPVPDQDPIPVKKNNQKVKWCAEFEFQISIDGYDDVSHTSGGSDCAYAAKTGLFANEGKVKYTISANGVDNDPELDIRP